MMSYMVVVGHKTGSDGNFVCFQQSMLHSHGGIDPSDPSSAVRKAYRRCCWNRCLQLAEKLPQKTTRDVAGRVVSMPMMMCGNEVVSALTLLTEITT